MADSLDDNGDSAGGGKGGRDAPHRRSEAGRSGSAGGLAGGRAFDQWLNRGLHRIFDDIANEPVPDELLRLIEDDRDKADDRG